MPARNPDSLGPISRLIGRLQRPLHNVPVEEVHQVFYDGERPRRVLSIGGGPSRLTPHEINLNVCAGPEVDVLADAHRLPFRDESLESVYANATLEHLEEPAQAIKEIWRVLSPGGRVYSIQPFLHPYHAHPSDYHRFTMETLERLFGDFDRVALMTHTGPTYALLKLCETYLLLFLPHLLPFGKRKITRLFQLIYWMVGFPFKFLDRLIFRLPEGHLLANTLLYIGRKPEKPTTC